MPNSIFSVGTIESAGPERRGKELCVRVGVKGEYECEYEYECERVCVSVYAAVRGNANE